MNEPDLVLNGTTLSSPQQKLRHANATAMDGGSTGNAGAVSSESWHPESAYRPMFFQTLDSGFRRNDDVIRDFSLKVVPLGADLS